MSRAIVVDRERSTTQYIDLRTGAIIDAPWWDWVEKIDRLYVRGATIRRIDTSGALHDAHAADRLPRAVKPPQDDPGTYVEVSVQDEEGWTVGEQEGRTIVDAILARARLETRRLVSPLEPTTERLRREGSVLPEDGSLLWWIDTPRASKATAPGMVWRLRHHGVVAVGSPYVEQASVGSSYGKPEHVYSLAVRLEDGPRAEEARLAPLRARLNDATTAEERRDAAECLKAARGGYCDCAACSRARADGGAS